MLVVGGPCLPTHRVGVRFGFVASGRRQDLNCREGTARDAGERWGQSRGYR